MVVMGVVKKEMLKPTTEEEREKYRNSKIKDINYDQWFWHHPSAYPYFKLGIPIVFVLMFGGAAVITRLIDWPWISTIFLSIIAVLCIIALKKSYFELKHTPKGTTMYDMLVDDNDTKSDVEKHIERLKKEEEGCEQCKI